MVLSLLDTLVHSDRHRHYPEGNVDTRQWIYRRFRHNRGTHFQVRTRVRTHYAANYIELGYPATRQRGDERAALCTEKARESERKREKELGKGREHLP